MWTKEYGEQKAKELNEQGKGFTNKENARRAGLKSVQVKREKRERTRTLQEICKWIGQMTLNKDELLSADEIQDLEKAKSINLTAWEASVLAQVQKALAGDTKAMEFLRDTAGEKPKDQIEVQGMTIDEYAKNHKMKF